MSNIDIDLEKFQQLAYSCYVQVKDNKYDGILCILNGGLYLADFLSKKMNLPIATINFKSYEEEKQKELKLLSYSIFIKGYYLIVDDIYDTGKTIERVKEFYGNNFDEIVLVSKNKKIKHGYYHSTNEWVDFFWEKF